MTKPTRTMGLPVLLLTAALAHGTSGRAPADLIFYTDEDAWATAASGVIETLDLFDAGVVALADEVASPPEDGDLLGTPVLTFDPAVTGLSQSFVLQLLESTDFQYQDEGSRFGLEPAGNSQEDFEQRIGGDGARAIGMRLSELQATSLWEFFDAGGTSLGSVSVAGAATPNIRFFGVVSDTPIVRAVFTHPGGENFGIGTQRFAPAAVIPEPASVALLAVGACALAASRRWRRRTLA